MMNKISTSFTHKHNVNFLIDNDEKMDYVSAVNLERFERFFVFVDKRVKAIWGGKVFKKLKSHDKQMFILEVDASEETKSLKYYPAAVNFLENKRCGLSDLVIAVGGGTIIDLVGFVCSTYMRSLQFIALPTTLIGQIDASTAGKTCLNSFGTKNILGTFYYPFEVYNNINFLKTNSPYYNRQGYSEVFKYGLLGSKKLLKLLEDYKKLGKQDTLTYLILEAIKVRIKIRKRNPLASNLGHTFGHAIEKVSNYKILHGDAISAGIVMSLFFSLKHGLIKRDTVEKIIKTMKSLRLNIYIDKQWNVDEIVEKIRRDKKSSNEFINLVLLTDIAKPYRSGSSYFFKTTPEEVRKFLREFLENYGFVIKNCASYIKNQLNYKM